MYRIFDNKRGEWLTALECFKIYGTDLTTWPDVCPGSGFHYANGEVVAHHKLRVYGQKALFVSASEKLPPRKLHRKVRFDFGFEHKAREAMNCPLRSRDDGRYDDLTNTLKERLEIAKQVKDEFYYPSNFDRTVAYLRYALKQNYSNQILLDLVAIMDAKNIWNWGFRPWAAPYIMLQQRDFLFHFKNGNAQNVRFVKATYDGQEYLRMVYAGTDTPVKGYKPYVISERNANEVYARSLKKSPQLLLPFAQAS
jgi:hypothetical protein